MKMNFILCVITLSAILIFLDFVQAMNDKQVVEYRNNNCSDKSAMCQHVVQEFFKLSEIATDDIMGLCNTRPRKNLVTFCLIECQMRIKYKWLNDDGFQKDEYIKYIKKSELGHDQTYVEAAQKAADLCTRTIDGYNGCIVAYDIITCLQTQGDKLQKINLGYGIFYVEPVFFKPAIPLFSDSGSYYEYSY